MKTSPEINELVAALAAAQGEFLPIEKNRTGKVQTEKANFSYEYADLSDVMAAVRPALSKNGLAISHDAVVSREPVLAVSVVARLEHSSGQWKESSPLEIPCDGRMGAAQLIGSADTYGRRYTTCSILGVVAESDDDGTVAAGQPAETAKRAPRPKCPECGKSEFVYENKQAPGWYCWKKPELQKHGCGHKWDTPIESATESPQEQRPSSGNVMADAPPKLSEADAKYIEDAAREFREATSDKQVRELWKLVASKPGPIKAALHPVYKDALNSFAGFTPS